MKFLGFILLGVALSGCATSPDYLDYLRHPQQLSRAYQACQAKEQPHCDMVYQAWQDYWPYVTAYQVNPADYGQRILAVQQQMAVLQKKLAHAQANEDSTLQAQYEQGLQQLEHEYQARLAVIRSGRTS